MKLDNKTIGRNIAKFRKLRDIKASEIAERLQLSESAYSKYERGETSITIEILQQIAEVLNIDPIQILAVTPGNFVESIQNSPNSGNNYNYVGGNFQIYDERQSQLLIKLMENVIELNQRLVSMFDKKA